MTSLNTQSKFSEFFTELKAHKKNKIHIIWLLARRTVYVILIVNFAFMYSRALLISLSIIQIWYAIFIGILRPYEEAKNNMIEIINQIFFIFFLIYFAWVNTESKWNDAASIIWIWMFALNIITAFSIVSSKHHILRV